jgi:hypothetical protein
VPAPLTVADEPVGRRTPIRITERGRAILAGDASYIRPPGEQRWLGGARLG